MTKLKEPTAQPAKPATPDARQLRRSVLAKNLANIRQRQAQGDTLKKYELQSIDALTSELEDLDREEGAVKQPKVMARGSKAADPGDDSTAPPDLSARSLADLAALAGLHRNSLQNYKARGIDPQGPPYSLRDFFLLLRRAGKLSETKPTKKKAQDLRSWCFGSGDNLDPDDPAHGATHGWKEERERQAALEQMISRRRAQDEYEIFRGNLVPIDKYRERWRKRAEQVLAALDRIMRIPAAKEWETAPLSQQQRAVLVIECRSAIADIRTAIGSGA